jgi:ATP-dependent DNA helicase RecG
MQPSLEKLRKFFRLEHENGYNNSAIIGGLAKMLDFWEGDARADGITEEVIQAVVQRLRSYDGLSPDSRADSLKGLWKRIGEQYPEAGQKPRSPQTGEDTRPNRPPRPPAVGGPAESPAPGGRNGPAPRPPQPADRRPRPPMPPGRSESAPGAMTSATPAALNAALTVLQGVGPKHAETLDKLGLHTLGDMLYYFPRRYEDYSQLKPIKSLWYGEQVTVIGTIESVNTRPIRGGRSQIVEAVLSDGTGALRLSWFNQPWMANRLKAGEQISVSGRVEQYLGRLVMNNPDEIGGRACTPTHVPIYHHRKGRRKLRGLMNKVVTTGRLRVDALPQACARPPG